MTTWTPATKQVETWTTIAAPGLRPRVFDSAVFDPAPIFDTEARPGSWGPKIPQIEVWTKL